MIINSARGLVKKAGGRLPNCSSQAFEKQVKPSFPAALARTGESHAGASHGFESADCADGQMDKQIEALAKRCSEIRTLRTAPGIGPLVAATYVLTLDQPHVIAPVAR